MGGAGGVLSGVSDVASVSPATIEGRLRMVGGAEARRGLGRAFGLMRDEILGREGDSLLPCCVEDLADVVDRDDSTGAPIRLGARPVPYAGSVNPRDLRDARGATKGSDDCASWFHIRKVAIFAIYGKCKIAIRATD